jgi:hypothetical protein
VRAQEHEAETQNRFYIGGRLHFNVKGTIQNTKQPAFTGPEYDDGFVSNDSSDSASGKSWNWGYSFTNQIFGTSPSRELELHGADSPRDGSVDRLNSDAEYGFEMGYGRDFWKFGKEEYPTRVGIEGSFSVGALGLDSRNTMAGTVTRVSDRYLLGSVIPPRPPYSGSFQGPVPPNPPTPLISTNIISHTTTTETATSHQESSLDGTYWGFRLGPYIEVPWPGYRFSFGGGFGLSMVQVDARFSYREEFTITGLGGPPQPREDSTRKADLLFGFYANAKVYYWLNDVVALYGGAEFQTLDNLTLEATHKSATLDFGNTFGITLGVMYAF